MTELQFLIDLLLNHKLPKATRQLVADRIAVVETELVQRPIVVPPRAIPAIQSMRMPQTEMQAPTINMAPVPGALLPKGERDKETGTVMVPTGNGTKGMRKF